MTASGKASGAMGAHNLHVVMSETIKGVGLFNGALYGIDEKLHPIIGLDQEAIEDDKGEIENDVVDDFTDEEPINTN